MPSIVSDALRLQLAWRHAAHCMSAGWPLQKFGVVVPFFAMSQMSPQPPADFSVVHAHSQSVDGTGMQAPLESQTSPAAQSLSLMHMPELPPVPPPPAAEPPDEPPPEPLELLPHAAAAIIPIAATAALKNQFIFISESLLDPRRVP
jgi:hypothetical protein